MTPHAPRKKTAPRAKHPSGCPCGVCEFIGLPYEEQLARKQEAVGRLFEPLALPDGVIRPIVGMDDPQGYRHKVAHPFAPGPQGTIRQGLYAPESHRLVAVPDCVIEHPRARIVMKQVAKLCERFGVEAYDERTAQGCIRHVVVRVGRVTEEVLVTLVAYPDTFPRAKEFAKQLIKACRFVTTVVLNENDTPGNTIFGMRERTLVGPGFIFDELMGLRFKISSRSFFQVNPLQAETLYRLAVEGSALRPGDVFIDAYCGTGTIGIAAAQACPEATVLGIESNEGAVADAQGNASHNGVSNATFSVGDAGMFMQAMNAAHRTLDVVMMDPPRSGASESFLTALIALAPERVVYVSCNPETQVRDCRILREAGYAITALTPVDMFPHTRHVETVLVLTRADGERANETLGK